MLFDYVIRYLLYYVRLLFNIELDVYIRKKIYPRCIVVTNVRDVEKIIISRWNTVSFFILFFFFPLKYLVSRFFFFFLYDICFMASKTTLGVRSIKKKKKNTINPLMRLICTCPYITFVGHVHAKTKTKFIV